jgi:hypothetical protein
MKPLTVKAVVLDAFFCYSFQKRKYEKNDIKQIKKTLLETLQLHSKENQACLDKEVKPVKRNLSQK